MKRDLAKYTKHKRTQPVFAPLKCERCKIELVKGMDYWSAGGSSVTYCDGCYKKVK